MTGFTKAAKIIVRGTVIAAITAGVIQLASKGTVLPENGTLAILGILGIAATGSAIRRVLHASEEGRRHLIPTACPNF